MGVQFLEEAICQRQGRLLSTGAFAVSTGPHTGRAASSRFIVRDAETESQVDWGEINKAFPLNEADQFFTKIEARLLRSNKGPLYRVQSHVGPYELELLTPSAWHAAFAENMFREEPIQTLVAQFRRNEKPIQIFHDPYRSADQYGITAPENAVILLDPTRLRIAIAGTAYAGEIKKSAFSMANYLLPAASVLPMHASANCLEDGSESSVIFGLSGTGKTTLSAQANRFLIGDDEIAWTETGLSNLEGGCYAKLVQLSLDSEPEIYKAVSRFGSILENVCFDEESREPDYTDISRTENTRGSYKLKALERVYNQAQESSLPKSVIFLSADAFGALPAVARLDEWQMRYHFMSGFTAKVAGTEMGLKEPKAAFSACFGAPFMLRNPAVYAHLLADRVRAAGCRVYLLNTGWLGGFQNGKRFPLTITRRLLSAIQDGTIDGSRTVRHPVFGFEVPLDIAGVDSDILKAPSGPEVEELARRFINNQKKFTGEDAREICLRGGPSLGDSLSDSTRDSTRAPLGHPGKETLNVTGA